MHILGPGIWREIVKNVENEKCTLQDLECGKKTEKHEVRHKHYMIWNMAKRMKYVENGKCTLYDLEYGKKKKPEKRGK